MLENILMSDNVVESINNNLDYLLELIPEIKAMIGFEHKHPHHHLDVWNHTLLASSLSGKNFEIRLVLLLHDIGKPHSYQEKDNIRHFNGHAKVSSIISKDILSRLEFDDEFIDIICYLIENHDTKISNTDIKLNYDLTYKRYLIQKCDALAHHPEKLEKRIKYLVKTKSKFKSCNKE